MRTMIPLGLLLLAGCPQPEVDPVGERAGTNQAWSIPDLTCASGQPYNDIDAQGGVSQYCHDGRFVQGESIRWHPNGQKATHGRYVDGKRTGTWVWWYENGQLATRGDYTNDKEDGSWTWWHLNGQVQMRGDHLNGQRMGEWQSWFANGQLERRGHYRNGRQDGEWKTFTSEGELQRTEEWDLGRMTDEKILIKEEDLEKKTP